eukprot:m.1261249 g.1261249  ORF g.1261249 m.1261249 type:complete len:149 (+) comp24730_c0_seq16:2058-2504(+)
MLDAPQPSQHNEHSFLSWFGAGGCCVPVGTSLRDGVSVLDTGRLAFAIAVATVTFLCVNENRGIVNWVLSLSLWEPLGKLTYGAYLVHPIIIRCYYFQQVMLFHYMPFNQFVVFVAMVFISYVVAAMLHVLVELPFASITKLIVTSRR